MELSILCRSGSSLKSTKRAWSAAASPTSLAHSRGVLLGTIAPARLDMIKISLIIAPAAWRSAVTCAVCLICVCATTERPVLGKLVVSFLAPSISLPSARYP
mgnify:CR=1 FL=1